MQIPHLCSFFIYTKKGFPKLNKQNCVTGLLWWDLLFEREDGKEDEHVGDEGEEEDGGEDAQLRHLTNINILAYINILARSSLYDIKPKI